MSQPVEGTHEKDMKVHDTGESDWVRTIAINTKGVSLGCKYAIKQMLEQEIFEG